MALAMDAFSSSGDATGRFPANAPKALSEFGLGLGIGMIIAAGLSRTVTIYSEPVSLTSLIKDDKEDLASLKGIVVGMIAPSCH